LSSKVLGSDVQGQSRRAPKANVGPHDRNIIMTKSKITFYTGSIFFLFGIAGIIYSWFSRPTKDVNEFKTDCLSSPLFDVVNVQRDESIVIMTNNLPPNQRYLISMEGVGTTKKSKLESSLISSESGGRDVLRMKIPQSFFGEPDIKVVIKDIDSGCYSLQSIQNSDFLSTSFDKFISYSGYPYFYVKNVVKDDNVSIIPSHFPPNEAFIVRMDSEKNSGIEGKIVDTVISDAHGNLSDTMFLIPDILIGENIIAIRLESLTSGYYSNNWFYNDDEFGIKDIQNPIPGIELSKAGFNAVPIPEIKIKTEYFSKLETKHNDNIRINLYSSIKQISNEVEVEGHASLIATPIPPLGDFDVPLDISLYKEYQICFYAKLIFDGTEIIDTDCRDLLAPTKEWDFVIKADEPGIKPAIVYVDMHWNLNNDVENTQQRQIFRKRFSVRLDFE